MKDFDAEFAARDDTVDRTFKIRGETFVRVASAKPEVIFSQDAPERFDTEEAALAYSDQWFLRMIEDRDDAHDRYRALRAREEEPLGLAEMRALKMWLIRELSGHPTNAPSSSGNGRATSGAGSKAPSSSTAAAA